MKLNKSLENKIRELAKTKTYPQIAEEIGTTVPSIACFCRRHKIKKTSKWEDKYLPVRRYFMKHSREETCQKFKITPANFKSIMCSVYRKEIAPELRKDERVKTPFVEWEKICIYSGIFTRQEIAEKIKRGSYHVVKDRFKQNKINGKTLNGLRLAQIENYFACSLKVWKTKAGPTLCRFTLVPWVELEDNLQYSKLPLSLKKGIKALAKFQRFIHKTKYNSVVKRNLTTMIGEPQMSKKNEIIEKTNNSMNVFDTKKVINVLEGLMEKVTSQRVDSSTVNAACNCADKITDILRLHLDVERLKIAISKSKDI